MRQLIAFAFVFVCIATMHGQDYHILPYSTVKTLKDGTSFYETRVKIHGFGIKEEYDEKGLDISLGNGFIDPKISRLPLMSGIKGWEEVEPVDYQLEQFEELKKQFVDGVNKKVKAAKKLPNGRLDKDVKKNLVREIEEYHEQLTKQAFNIFLPSQIENWTQYQFRLTFETSPKLALSDTVVTKKLGLSKSQLNDVVRIEQQSKKNVRSIRAEVQKEKQELVSREREKFLDILSSAQLEKLEQMLGKKLK